VHNEEYSDKSRSLGVLYNYSNIDNWSDSLVYIFDGKKMIYIFFNTIIDMADYLLYADPKVKRAYLEEREFDKIYDAPHIEGKFSEQLNWDTAPQE